MPTDTPLPAAQLPSYEFERSLGLSTHGSRRPFEFELEGECIVCTSHKRTYQGYISTMNQKKMVRLHRVVYEALVGPIPEGYCVRHTCDNPPCCNPDHLLVGTLGDNSADKVERRRHPFGERHWSAKLTECSVLEIRGDTLHTTRELAAKYGVGLRTIHLIRKGETWKHIQPQG